LVRISDRLCSKKIPPTLRMRTLRKRAPKTCWSSNVKLNPLTLNFKHSLSQFVPDQQITSKFCRFCAHLNKNWSLEASRKDARSAFPGKPFRCISWSFPRTHIHTQTREGASTPNSPLTAHRAPRTAQWRSTQNATKDHRKPQTTNRNQHFVDYPPHKSNHTPHTIHNKRNERTQFTRPKFPQVIEKPPKINSIRGYMGARCALSAKLTQPYAVKSYQDQKNMRRISLQWS